MATVEGHEEHEETVTPETVATKPQETAEHVEPHNDLQGIVAALDAKVTELTEIVHSLTPGVRDETPRKKPWTHAGRW